MSKLVDMVSNLCTEVKSITEDNSDLQREIKSMKSKTKHPRQGSRDRECHDVSSDGSRSQFDHMDRGRSRYREDIARGRRSSYSRSNSNSPRRFHVESNSYSFDISNFGDSQRNFRRHRSPEMYRGDDDRFDFRSTRPFDYNTKRGDYSYSRNRSPSPRKRVTFLVSPTRGRYEGTSDERYYSNYNRSGNDHLNPSRSIMRVNCRPNWRH